MEVHTTEWMHHSHADLAFREKARRKLHNDATSYIKLILEVTSRKTATLRPPTIHLEENPN